MTSAVPEAAAPARPQEIRALTGLRIVAALWVLVFHFGFTPGISGARFWRPLDPLVAAGQLGVDLFYVLSGFVITLTYVDSLGRRPAARRTVAFWWARFCRIWPVYAVVTTLFGIWLAAKETFGSSTNVAYQAVQPVVDVPHYLEQLVMVQMWHRPFLDGSSFVGPAWSVSVEVAAYLCFPVLALLLWRLRGAWPAVQGLLAVAAMVPLAWMTWSTGSIFHPWSWVLRIAGGFVAGSLTCLAVRRFRPTPWVDRLATATVVLSAAGIVAGVWVLPRLSSASGSGWAVVALFPVLVGALALSTRGPSRLLASRAAVHGGRISYSLYLVHVPVFEVLWTAMAHGRLLRPGGALFRIVVPAAVVVVVLLAHLSYRFIEEPARLALRARGPGRWARRQPAAPQVVPAD